MKKLLALVLIACMLPLSTLAVELGEDVTGTVCWPEGTDETTAVYVYRYAYPTVAGEDDIAGLINENFAYMIEDALAFKVPMTGETLESTDVQAYTNELSRITCNNDEYLSVLVVSEAFLGAAAQEVYYGYTFSLTGLRAGQVTSLPRLLGILKDDEEDTWMQERQTRKANELVWGLVWGIIEEQQREGLITFDPDLSFEMLQQDFYPEQDFYLDENGNPVFFIQAATIASAADGVLTFPFTVEELLDEL
ncbi:MAG: hypothetical protein IKK21_10100 [Clostridia bacterium]|nr:hypothetical protein [Clostridia bacterium]